jgi:DNA-binding NarL/FixJ family response regulator
MTASAPVLGSNIESCDSARPDSVVVEVLFIDDEPAVLAGLRRMLRPQRTRWNMTFIDTPAEALRLLASKHFDAIVTDYQMHGINGADVLTLARRRQPHAARLILSGQVDTDEIDRLSVLAHFCLSKPCDGPVIVAAVEQAVRITQTAPSEDVPAD